MTAAGGQDRISRKERIARAAADMPANHPELITRKPGRAEWKQPTGWLAELRPNDEYTAILNEAWRQDHRDRWQAARRQRRSTDGRAHPPRLLLTVEQAAERIGRASCRERV